MLVCQASQPDPTPDEIRQPAAEIHRKWTKAEERCRRVIRNERPTIRIYHEADLPVATTNESL